MDSLSAKGIEYRVIGSGPLLICIAGLDGTGELFYKLTPSLSQKFRVVTYQQKDDGEFTYDDLSGEIADLIDSLEEQRAILVGQSFGGTIALHFASIFPEKLDSLVLINTFPVFPGRIRIRLASLLAPMFPSKLIWQIRRIINTKGLRAEGVDEETINRFLDVCSSVESHAYARRLRLIAGFDARGWISGIKSPVLIIAGTEDKLLASESSAAFMSSLFPNVTLRTIEGAGHSMLLNEESGLASIISDWHRTRCQLPKPLQDR